MNNRRLPRAARGARELVPPPRAPIGENALRAAYGAHKSDRHGDQPGRGCRTCRRYLAALIAAQAAPPTPQDPTP